MKKCLLILICILTLPLLCSCTKEQTDMEITDSKTFTVINEATDADIWILPQTEKNQKTTVWGAATAEKVKTGESRRAELCDPGDDGLYLLRMIDADSYYYAAGDITLEADWSIRIKAVDVMTVTAEVTDENGILKDTYEVFTARL